MSKNYLFVDVQGFKNDENEFIVKELALATPEYTEVFLIKPPFSYTNLTRSEKRQTRWIEKNRGICWSEGFIDYREFRRIIKPILNGKKLFVKGLEKIEWIKKLCNNCAIVDVGEKGCPSFLNLYTTYCKNNVNLNCFYHSKYCALKNVICIRQWFIDNSLNQFF